MVIKGHNWFQTHYFCGIVIYHRSVWTAASTLASAQQTLIILHYILFLSFSILLLLLLPVFFCNYRPSRGGEGVTEGWGRRGILRQRAEQLSHPHTQADRCLRQPTTSALSSVRPLFIHATLTDANLAELHMCVSVTCVCVSHQMLTWNTGSQHFLPNTCAPAILTTLVVTNTLNNTTIQPLSRHTKGLVDWVRPLKLKPSGLPLLKTSLKKFYSNIIMTLSCDSQLYYPVDGHHSHWSTNKYSCLYERKHRRDRENMETPHKDHSWPAERRTATLGY